MVESTTNISGQQPFLVYLNLNQGIRINYPAGWFKREQSSPEAFVVMFNSPPEDPKDQFSESLNIVVEPLPQGIILEQYVQGCLAAMQQAPFQFLEENTRVVVGGRPAYRNVYIGPLTGPLPIPVPLSGKWLQYLMIGNGKGYVVTYTAEERRYEKFLPVIQQMVDSLEIK